MSQNTKTLRVRIKSVNSTMQLTNAMGLVASSKIRRANEAMLKGRAYSEALDSTMNVLTSDRESLKSPYMKEREALRTRLIVIAGDRGLAGGYNVNVFRLASEYPDAEIIPIGRRACDRYEKTYVSSEKYSFNEAYALAEELCRDFSEEKFDRLGIIWTKYNSIMSQEAVLTWLLPLRKYEGKDIPGIVFEPDHLTVLNNIVREYVAGKITVCIRESFASEVSARRMAMDSSSKNAQKMINDLQLEYNRARQGAITQEITEIVAGSGN